MRFEPLQAKFKDGSVVEGQVAWPENMEELLKVYPEERIYKLGLAEYLIKAKKRLKSRRSPRLTFRLTDLTVQQQAALRKLGLLKQG